MIFLLLGTKIQSGDLPVSTVPHKPRYSPVTPGGDADSLDDDNDHMAEKHKEEEEEVEGAVTPKQ